MSQIFCPPNLAEPSTLNLRAVDQGAGGGDGAQQDSEEMGLSYHQGRHELGLGHNEERGTPRIKPGFLIQENVVHLSKNVMTGSFHFQSVFPYII